MNKRISYIDTAKCIAIFCLVMGHTNCAAREFLYSFHVQMFFICTGFTYLQKYHSVSEYLQTGFPKLVKRIFIPYVLLILIFNVQLKAENLPWLLWGSDQTVMHGKQFSFMWFLPIYFSAVFIWNLITIMQAKYNNRKYILPLLVLLLAIPSYLTRNNAHLSIELSGYIFYLTGYQEFPPHSHYIGFPMNVNVAGTAIVFLYIGTLLRKLFDYMKFSERRRMTTIGVIFFMGLGLGCFILNTTYFKPSDSYPYIIAMSYGAYGNYILFLLTAVAVSISLICLATMIDCKPLAWIGKNTFGIYSMHPFVRNVIMFILGIYGYIMFTAIGGIIMFVSTILFLPFVKKWFPFVIGE